jgi:hypothetical protein
VDIAALQQGTADFLTRTGFEQDVVRHDHCGGAGLLEHRIDVLHEVQLLVARRGPEILALVIDFLRLAFSFVVDDGDAAFFPEGWIGEHHVHDGRFLGEAVGSLDNRLFRAAHTVQIKIHGAEPRDARHDVHSADGLLVEKPLGLAIQTGIRLHQILVGSEEEASCAARGIGDVHRWFGAHPCVRRGVVRPHQRLQGIS